MKKTGLFYLGGILITATQWRYFARRFVDANIRRAKRGQHKIPARAAAEILPQLFSSSTGMVGLNYRLQEENTE